MDYFEKIKNAKHVHQLAALLYGCEACLLCTKIQYLSTNGFESTRFDM